jgi:sterol desaturase/sphingolipid hydroxylase (fatty acid hydroxylase superfamily)
MLGKHGKVCHHAPFAQLPRWFMKTPLKWVLNTLTNHIMHHETLRGNYGFYFNIWDRLMGTNHANDESRFAEVTTRDPISYSSSSSSSSNPSPRLLRFHDTCSPRSSTKLI